LFAPERFLAAGLHGVERRGRRGRVDDAAAPAALGTLREQAVRLAAGYPGAVVEDKGAALGLHWRSAPGAETALRAFAEQALPQLPGYQ
ncbi:hypothetical protein, partial [Bacillus sp. SIMBA_005]|uniref:hypothetical protein n=1 Tax=Bacillus sp. SIMBA_005 TaxID=3085754 RepID=UPI00397B766A